MQKSVPLALQLAVYDSVWKEVGYLSIPADREVLSQIARALRQAISMRNSEPSFVLAQYLFARMTLTLGERLPEWVHIAPHVPGNARFEQAHMYCDPTTFWFSGVIAETGELWTSSRAGMHELLRLKEG